MSTSGSLRASEKDGAVVLDVLVQTRARREGIGAMVDGRLRVMVEAPPVDGRANRAVGRVLAAAFDVPPSAVEILRGETGRRKTVRIRRITLAALAAKIAGTGDP